jgi:hypothetical protein
MMGWNSHPLAVGESCSFEWAKMRDFCWFELYQGSSGLFFLDDGFFDVLKLEQRCIFDLVNLNGVILDFS